jgi:hypothetical protein
MSINIPETENLLNPAFCATVFLSVVDGYNSKTNTKIPLYLPYILLAIILHKPSRVSIPKTSVTKFQPWIQGNSEVRIGLSNRVRSLKPYVSNALMLLFSDGVISLDDKGDIDIIDVKKAKKIMNFSKDIEMYTKKARTLGTICAKNNSDMTILALLGVSL